MKITCFPISGNVMHFRTSVCRQSSPTVPHFHSPRRTRTLRHTGHGRLYAIRVNGSTATPEHLSSLVDTNASESNRCDTQSTRVGPCVFATFFWRLVYVHLKNRTDAAKGANRLWCVLRTAWPHWGRERSMPCVPPDDFRHCAPSHVMAAPKT